MSSNAATEEVQVTRSDASGVKVVVTITEGELKTTWSCKTFTDHIKETTSAVLKQARRAHEDMKAGLA